MTEAIERTRSKINEVVYGESYSADDLLTNPETFFTDQYIMDVLLLGTRYVASRVDSKYIQPLLEEVDHDTIYSTAGVYRVVDTSVHGENGYADRISIDYARHNNLSESTDHYYTHEGLDLKSVNGAALTASVVINPEVVTVNLSDLDYTITTDGLSFLSVADLPWGVNAASVIKSNTEAQTTKTAGDNLEFTIDSAVSIDFHPYGALPPSLQQIVETYATVVVSIVMGYSEKFDYLMTKLKSEIEPFSIPRFSS